MKNTRHIKTTEELWINCSDKKLLKELDSCPEIIEELKKHHKTDITGLVGIYDSILPKYQMDWGFYTINSGRRSGYFTYWYKVDDEKADMAQYESFKIVAEAQLRAVHKTMYKLRNRIIDSQTPR